MALDQQEKILVTLFFTKFNILYNLYCAELNVMCHVENCTLSLEFKSLGKLMMLLVMIEKLLPHKIRFVSESVICDFC